MKKISEDTTLAKILKYPEAEEILLKYNLPCLGCPFAKMEMGELKIGQVCQMYGIETKELLKDLNEKLKNS